MQAAGRFLTERRLLAWGLFFLLCIPPALGFSGYRWASEKHENWGGEASRADLPHTEAEFAQAEFPCILVAECESFLRPDNLAALRAMIERLERKGLVQQLLWPGSIQEFTLTGGVRPLLPAGLQGDALRDRMAQVAVHPLVRGQILSDDHRTMLLPFVPAEFRRRDSQRIRAVVQAALNGTGVTARLTGPLPLWHAHRTAFEEDHLRIIGLACGLVVILALVIFRRPSAILIACSGPTVGMIWTLGWLSLLGETGNDLAENILPVMVLMVGFTDGVHLVAQIRQERAQGRSSVEAVSSAVRHVGVACFLTSLTTAIGFGSLLLAQSPIIQGFGRASTIGVMVTFVAVLLVIPLVSTSWFGRRMHLGLEHDLVGRHIERLSSLLRWITGHARLVSILGILMTAAFCAGAMRLQPDDRLGHRIPNHSDAYAALMHADRAMGGIRTFRVVIHWEKDTDPVVVFDAIRDVERILGEQPLISAPLSIRSLLTVLPGADGPAKLLLAGLIPQTYRNRFWQPEHHSAQVVARIQDRGMVVYRPVLDDVERKIKDLTSRHPDLKMHLTGDAIIESRIVQRVVRELMQSLLTAGVIIFAVIAIAFRSIRFGILSVIPNVLPLAVTGTLRACLDTSLDISSACSFAVCLGIAVDDTIHFMTRFRHERSAGHSPEDSVCRAFTTVGGALIMTTIVLVAGFGSVMTSQLPTHFLFAAMACTTIGTALAGDLIVLPALMAWFPGASRPEPLPDSGL